jgi:serine protease Do
MTYGFDRASSGIPRSDLVASAAIDRRRWLAAAGGFLLAAACPVAPAPSAWAAPPAAPSESRMSPIVVAAQRARPSVVNIRGEKNISANDTRRTQGETGRRVNGMGTGVILDERGYITTNHHVGEGVRKITVTTAAEESYTARLISYDAKTDLAIIKIDAEQSLPSIDLGASSDLMPGETVIAVGNAFGYEHTVTRGIISALHRTVQVSDTQSYEDLIQTDASINPGNSGGPLLNIDGQLIGVNVAVRAGAQGIGFAIPVDRVLEIAGELLSARRLNEVWHGVEAGPADECLEGVAVSQVDDDSPAAAIGLRPGDAISRAGELTVTRTLDLERAFLGKRPGDSVPLRVVRDGETLSLDLVLASAPSGSDQIESGSPAWEALGLELKPLEPGRFKKYKTKYRGGLSVVNVRPGGPAASQKIRAGDVLVGMHIWETVTLENVQYILDRPDFAGLQPVKFYILRGKETYFFEMTVSHRKSRNK